MTIYHLLLALGLCSLTIAAPAQQTHPTPANAPAAYYIDSNLVDLAKCIFNVNDITDVTVVKGYDSALGTNGKVYITTRNPPMRLDPLGKVIASRPELIGRSPLLFVVGDTLLTDTAGVRMEPSLTKYIKIADGSDLRYLPPKSPSRSLAVLFITTKPDTAQKIILR